jgi:hypothetical protein
MLVNSVVDCRKLRGQSFKLASDAAVWVPVAGPDENRYSLTVSVPGSVAIYIAFQVTPPNVSPIYFVVSAFLAMRTFTRAELGDVITLPVWAYAPGGSTAFTGVDVTELA